MVNRSLRVVDEALKWVVAIVLLAMVVLTFIDVLLRDFVGRPIPSGLEISELMLVVLIFSSLPLVSRAAQHVVLDTLDGLWSRRTRRRIDYLANVVSALALLGLAWLLAVRAIRTEADGAVTPVLYLPIWPFVWYMAALVAATAIAHLLLLRKAPETVAHRDNDLAGGGL